MFFCICFFGFRKLLLGDVYFLKNILFSLPGMTIIGLLPISCKYSAHDFFLPPPVQFKQQLDEEKKVRKMKDEEIQGLKGILSVFIIYFRYLK